MININNKLRCTWCNSAITDPTKSQMDGYRRRGRIYCSKECAANYSRTISSATMAKTNAIYAAKRMRDNNPMKNPNSREKMRQTLIKINHAPKVRMGNGTGLTKPQALLLSGLSAFHPIPEYAIQTKRAREGYPTVYKVDIAIPDFKIAIEVDGASHGAISRQQEDARKSEFLRSAGWTVIRFKNEDIMRNRWECIYRIEELTNEA